MVAIVEVNVVSLVKNWWAVALRGAAALIFGILTAFWPDISLTALVLLFGSFAIVYGVFNIITAVRRRRGERRWWALLLEGLVSVAVGTVTLIMPDLTALALVYVIAAWALLTGILEVAAAIMLRRHIRGEWWLALAGVLSVAFGAVLAIWPGVGALALVLWIGAYAIVLGILLIALGIKLRRLWFELPDPDAVVLHA
jgi:uncharacterized membrane protein HdeD (DUF308 family)